MKPPRVTCDVARILVAAPKLALFSDSNQAIAISYLNAAGIPDSNGNPWSVFPDRQSLGTPLMVHKNAGTPGHLDLAWGDSCGPGQTDFAVYEGVTGAWYSHSAKLCSTGGAFAANDLTPAAGNTYYLIVALSPAVEGSYGTNSSDVEIPQGSGACRALRDLTGCP